MSTIEIFRALASLTTTMTSRPTPLPVTSVEEAVAAGVVLARFSVWAELQLHHIKQVLRAEAGRRLGGAPGAVVVPGIGVGAARVFLPLPTLQVREGLDQDQLRANLGPAFDDWIALQCRLVAGASRRYHQATPGTRQALAAAFRLVPATPRVTFLDPAVRSPSEVDVDAFADRS